MQLCLSLEVLSSVYLEEVDSSQQWVTDIVTSLESKNPDHVSRFFGDNEYATLTIEGVSPIVGPSELHEIHEWMFKANTDFEWTLKTGKGYSIFHL